MHYFLQISLVNILMHVDKFIKYLSERIRSGQLSVRAALKNITISINCTGTKTLTITGIARCFTHVEKFYAKHFSSAHCEISFSSICLYNVYDIENNTHTRARVLYLGVLLCTART